jgi:predicted short-subunit dehydrogenase-like oxidoreductase (DUF2520 family)
MTTVSIIGIGRVGGALALALPAVGYQIDKLVYRKDAPAAAFPRTEAVTLDQLSSMGSDIVFISTQDSEIASAADALAQKLDSTPYVFHTSGALSSEALKKLADIGCKTGSIHPLVSISAAELGPERFRGSYFCIEGQPEAVTVANDIVTALGGMPFSVPTEFKTLYHAAAVTACGHLVALFDAAVEMMSKCGLSPDESKKILLPLVKSTIQNLDEQTTGEALTGTFARADVETFVNHLKTLNMNVSDELLEIYLLLGERSLELAATQGVSSDRIESMQAKVSIAKSKLKW